MKEFDTNISLISSDKNWIEYTAIQQLRKLGTLQGVKRVVGLPDLHPGKVPIGTVTITNGIIYPHLVGNDVGCGMSLFQTEIETRKTKLDRWVSRLESARELQITMKGINPDEVPCGYEEYLGTIGSGNHFAEIQEIDQVYDESLLLNMGIDAKRLFILVHSGSRRLGNSLYRKYVKDDDYCPALEIDGTEALAYMEEHNQAVKWACINRRIIAGSLIETMGLDCYTEKIIDSVHNFIQLTEEDGETVVIHRKGAAPADLGAAVIPGSRGAKTYIVMPQGDIKRSGYSIAHGAGRKWARSMCKSRVCNLYNKDNMKTTKFKSRIICRDMNLLFQEAPEAYKNIDTVVEELVSEGLIKVIATTRPVLTYKA